MYHTKLYFLDNTPNQILHIESTLLSWLKRFYTTIGLYPALYNFLAVTQEDLIQWEYHLDNPNTNANLKIFLSTFLPPPLYSGEMSHHMHDPGESRHSSVHQTVNMTSLSICQSHNSSVCHTINMTSPSVCLLHGSSVCQTKCDSSWNSICLSVHPLSVPSILPSAKFMVKMPMSIPVLEFPNTRYLGKLLSICTSTDWFVDTSGSLSVTLSSSAANPSKFSSNNGENHAVN